MAVKAATMSLRVVQSYIIVGLDHSFGTFVFPSHLIGFQRGTCVCAYASAFLLNFCLLTGNP